VQAQSMKANFNSSMVRLKDNGVYLSGNETNNFNSSMVRLKEIYCDEAEPKSIISIPVWCD